MSSREIANPPHDGTLGEIQNIEKLNKKLKGERKDQDEKLKTAKAESAKLKARKEKVQEKKDTLIDQIKRLKQRKDTIDKQIKIIEAMSDDKEKSTLPFEDEIKALQDKTIKAVNVEKDKLEDVIRTLKEVYETKHKETQTEKYAPIDQSLAEAVRKCHVAVGENQELTQKKKDEVASLGGVFNREVEVENRKLKAQAKKHVKKITEVEKKLEAYEGKNKTTAVAASNPRKRKNDDKSSASSAKKRPHQSSSDEESEESASNSD